ncbi:serine/threonine protein kinase [Xenorhabdus khoisanae]|uniref:Serine/threonine protein kinase n=1 Tax=Xenorhabdus khoisanae TaxID=880157 RepID=A0A0J5FS84_9GAMM|nr:type II toxin-antitoxin system HipA family toxin [Xenorhabdus khoisanae]KMJ45131.1 serine/threonine protein kinase [Xenorhabdus khoisanae]
MKSQHLTVAMNGTEVGILFRDTSGAMSFQYKKSWIKTVGSRAISFSLPLTSHKYTGREVFNFFSNLLPDSSIILARMQAKFKIATSHPFDLLASVGRDCIGAIQLYPEDSKIPPVREIHAEPLSEGDIIQLIDDYRTAPLGMNNDTDFRISLAGAQEKTALLWYQERWQRPIGSTPTSHIFKLPIGRIEQNNIDLSESCENEWLCLKIAKEFGFPVADAELATFGNKKVLIVRRFDRRWSNDGSWLMRLPQEDMCQALGVSSAQKYESDGGPSISDIMKLLISSRQSTLDRETFFRTQILFWLLAAIDGHAKNFSLFIDAGSSFTMTPLYDIISAYPLFHPKGIPQQKAKMAMALQGKNRQYHWAKILPRHFLNTADHVGISPELAKKFLTEIGQQTPDVIQKVSAQLPDNFPTHISDAIFKGIEKQAIKLLKAILG